MESIIELVLGVEKRIQRCTDVVEAKDLPTFVTRGRDWIELALIADKTLEVYLSSYHMRSYVDDPFAKTSYSISIAPQGAGPRPTSWGYGESLFENRKDGLLTIVRGQVAKQEPEIISALTQESRREVYTELKIWDGKYRNTEYVDIGKDVGRMPGYKSYRITDAIKR